MNEPETFSEDGKTSHLTTVLNSTTDRHVVTVTRLEGDSVLSGALTLQTSDPTKPTSTTSFRPARRVSGPARLDSQGKPSGSCQP